MGKFEYEDAGVMDYTHLRWYTFKSAQDLLEANGYNIEKAWADVGVPFYRLLKHLPVIVQVLIKRTLSRISKGLFSGELLFIAKSN